MSEEVLYTIGPLDPSNKNDVEAVSRLHSKLLDWGPISQLGILFLRHLVYSSLVQDDLIQAVLCKVNDTPAGFITYTIHSNTFYRKGFIRHWLKSFFLILISILQNPRVLLRLSRVLLLLFSFRSEKTKEEDPSAEILAIGVLPEYRNPQFIYTTGFHLSRDLVERAVSYFKSRGLKKMHLFVDEFNKPVIYFYKFMGGNASPYRRAGETMIKIWFDLNDIEF